MMKRVVLMLMMAALAAASQADLVVDFNPNTAYVGARSADISTLNGDTWNFSDTTPLIGSGGGQNDTIYGGVVSTWSVEKDSSPYFRHINWSVGGFEIQNNPANGSFTSLKAVYIWNKADFLTGSTETLGFTAGDSIAFNFSWFTAYNQDLRLVAKQGGTYYISQWYTTGAGFGGANVVTDPSATGWAALNTADYTWGDFDSITMDDIEAVGLYYTIDTGAVIDQTAARLKEFQVDASVVPEPATMALLGLGGLLLRRKK